MLFSCVTILEQKGKSNVKLLYFQNIRALKKKKLKYVQNTENWPILFSKLYRIGPNTDSKNAQETKASYIST
jgi:hypothetical protein